MLIVGKFFPLWGKIPDMKKTIGLRVISIALLLIIFVSACNQATSPTTLIIPTEPIIIPETQIPSSTPTQIPSAQIILLAPIEADPLIVSQVRVFLQKILPEKELEFEEKLVLIPSDLSQEVKLVIAISPSSDLISLSSLFPNINFLAIAGVDIEPTDNVFVLPGISGVIKNSAFLAGYLSVLVTEDYRVGSLVLAGNETGLQATNSFSIGARYFCGLCGSKLGPIYYYPKSAEINDPSFENDWKAAADALIAFNVKTVFIDNNAFSDELAEYLTQSNISIIALASPPATILQEYWLGSLEIDYAGSMNKYWALLTSEEQGQYLIPDIILTQINNELVSEGKLRLFNEIKGELEAGFINPSPVP